MNTDLMNFDNKGFYSSSTDIADADHEFDPLLDDVNFIGKKEEDLDRIFSSRKPSNRKILLHSYVLDILMDNTCAEGRHLTQGAICQALRQYPYELVVDRRTISGVLKDLVQSGIGVVYSEREGAWINTDRHME